MPLDLPKLRQLAEKATPGPWDYERSYIIDDDDDEGYNGKIHMRVGPIESCDKCPIATDADAAFIAAANPATVLELIDEVELAKEIKRMAIEVKFERDALRSQLATAKEAIQKASDAWCIKPHCGCYLCKALEGMEDK